MVVEKSFNIIFSTVNADSVNDDMNEFKVNLYNGISVPKQAKSAQVALYSARVWNSSPNIVPDVNDKLYITYQATPYVIEVPQGLYSDSLLAQTLSLLFEQESLPIDLISFIADIATQKILIRYNYADTQIDFTPADTFRDILGFDARLSPPTPSTLGELDSADNEAGFNTVNSFLITAENLVRDGIPIGATAINILAEVPIIAPPNSLINYEPNNLTFIQSDHLIGSQIFDFTFRILNEKAQPIKMIEDWSFSVVVRYQLYD